ncbi:MAG: hypothetical protein IKA36_06920 [Clostridia bacterium]|nr:hypothetical protein [Clostridia bacterium]
MIITDPNQLDLTGENSSYKRDLRRFKIFTANQTVDLEDTAYAHTLKVYLVTGVDENNNPSLTLINKGSYAKQWNIDSSCKDITATAKAKFRYGYDAPEFLPTADTHYQSGKNYYFKSIENGVTTYKLFTSYTVGAAIPKDSSGNIQYYEKDQDTWNFELINKFFMNDSSSDIAESGEYEIAVEYQALELECMAIQQDGLGPEYSPGLMRSMIDKIEELYYVRNPINNVSATTTADMHCLEEDLTGAKIENYITGEVHRVDVVNNLYVIRPQCGSFYNTSSLRLEFQPDQDPTAGTTVLTKETVDTNGNVIEGDYVVTGINKEKTAVSDPTCGVYEYIVLKKSFVGKVFVSYQAFGGEVTQADINALKDIVQNVYRTVTAMDIVTVSNLSNTSIIKELVYRQQLIEHTIGHFQSQRFKYTTAQTDKWVNIAFVDRNPWTADAPVPTSCIGEFRIKVPDMDFFMDVKITFDTNAAKVIDISVYHADIPSFDKNKFEYFTKRVLPKFRLIWCSAQLADKPGTERGIMLQMSMTSQTPTLCTVIVDDMTGAKSPWDLIDTLGKERPGTDNTKVDYYTNNVVRYGDYTEDSEKRKSYVFDWKSAIDRTSNLVPLYPAGYTVFVGSIPMNAIEEVSVSHSDAEFGDVPEILTSGYEVTPIITGTDIDLTQVKAVEFKVFDRYTEKYLIGRSQKVNCQNTTLSAEALYFVDDLCLVSCTLVFNGTNYTMKLNSRTGTNSLNNDRFDLVQIDLIG